MDRSAVGARARARSSRPRSWTASKRLHHERLEREVLPELPERCSDRIARDVLLVAHACERIGRLSARGRIGTTHMGALKRGLGVREQEPPRLGDAYDLEVIRGP